jgi:hypothetical protein
MSKPREQVQNAARVALQVKTVAYRLLTFESGERLEFARFFLDDFCTSSFGIRATDADAEQLLEWVRAGFSVSDYFEEPAAGEAIPVDIPFSVYQSVVTGYSQHLFAPAFERCDLSAVYLRIRRHLDFFNLVHSGGRPDPVSEEEVDEFLTLSVDIMPCLRGSISRAELASILGLGDRG